jgi:hypothetical protein
MRVWKATSQRQLPPGHDQKLRANLEERVGGLISLRMLVEAAEHHVNGSLGSSMFSNMVKDLLLNREAQR